MATWWTTGAYDIVLVCEGPEDAMMTAALRTAALGNVRTQTLRGFSAAEMHSLGGEALSADSVLAGALAACIAASHAGADPARGSGAGRESGGALSGPRSRSTTERRERHLVNASRDVHATRTPRMGPSIAPPDTLPRLHRGVPASRGTARSCRAGVAPAGAGPIRGVLNAGMAQGC